MFFTSLNDLLLEVYVIGYPDQGESQIILLKDEKTIYFSCVIDCYRDKLVNKTLETLRSLGIKRLDMFIWTHTDEDHSLDIKSLVEEFCDVSTSFILPEFVNGDLRDFVDYNREIKESLDLINKYNRERNYSVATATVVPQSHSNLWRNEFCDTVSSTILLFEILAVAPCSALLRRRFQSGDIKNKNDLSIATIFKIGELSIFLGGDIEDQTISQIANYHFSKIHFIKTPHHTSTSSTKLIQRLEDNKTRALKSVSTVYKRHSLPHSDIVMQYKKVSDSFYSTGTGPNDWGMDMTQFNVILNKIVSHRQEGNCIQLF